MSIGHDADLAEPWAEEDNAVRSSPSGMEAADHHERGLKALERAIQRGSLADLKTAEKAIKAALAAVTPTIETEAFRLRATTNLAIVLRRMGRAADAVKLLEKFTSTIADNGGQWFHVPRAFDSLGSAYLADKRPDQAIAAYDKARQLLEKGLRKDDDWHRLLIRTLSNRARASLAINDLQNALSAITQAVGVLSRINDPLTLARTRSMQGNVFFRHAASLYQQNRQVEACEFLEGTLEAFEEARQVLEYHGAIADSTAAAVSLAGAERTLGQLLSISLSEPDQLSGIDHLSRAIKLYAETFPKLDKEEARNSVRQSAAKALHLYILNMAKNRDFIEGSPNTINTHFSVCHRALLIIHGEINPNFTNNDLSLGVVRPDNIAAAIADIFASWNVSETEAREVLPKVYQRLGWSTPLVMPREAADEITGREAKADAFIPQSISELPTGMQWPTERFDEAPEFGTWGGIVGYLRRVWKPIKDAGIIVTRSHLDPSARKAVSNYERGDRKLPADVSIRTKPELIDQALEAIPDPAAALRLARALESRRRRSARPK